LGWSTAGFDGGCILANHPLWWTGFGIGLGPKKLGWVNSLPTIEVSTSQVQESFAEGSFCSFYGVIDSLNLEDFRVCFCFPQLQSREARGVFKHNLVEEMAHPGENHH
jgi:hypothetical protein